MEVQEGVRNPGPAIQREIQEPHFHLVTCRSARLSLELQSHRNKSIRMHKPSRTEGLTKEYLPNKFPDSTEWGPASVLQENLTFPFTPPLLLTAHPNLESLEPSNNTKSNHYLTQVTKAAPSPGIRGDGHSSRKKAVKLQLLNGFFFSSVNKYITEMMAKPTEKKNVQFTFQCPNLFIYLHKRHYPWLVSVCISTCELL